MATKDQRTPTSVPIETIVDAAMRSKGWLLPTTEDAVAELEAEMQAHPVEVPDSLKSTGSVFEEVTQRPVQRAQPRGKPMTQAAENLALAAREGGQIPDEVREIMNQDREATEREYERKSKNG